MNTFSAAHKRKVILTGWLGLLGALFVGVGEFSLQFSPLGGYEASDYSYFARVSDIRLTYGHFFSVLAAPLYLLGYWHIGQMFVRGGSYRSGWFITLFGGYAFVVGAAWLGGRVYLAYTAKMIAGGGGEELVFTLTSLLNIFAEHNEPLVNVLRIAMLLISVLWIIQIGAGRTLYPRWMAIFSPIALLATIFAIYFYVSESLGAWLLPAAMNVVHVVVFSLSLYIASRVQKTDLNTS